MTLAIPPDIKFTLMSQGFDGAEFESVYNDYMDIVTDSTEFESIVGFDKRLVYINCACNDMHSAYCAYPA